MTVRCFIASRLKKKKSQQKIHCLDVQIIFILVPNALSNKYIIQFYQINIPNIFQINAIFQINKLQINTSLLTDNLLEQFQRAISKDSLFYLFFSSQLNSPDFKTINTVHYK